VSELMETVLGKDHSETLTPLYSLAYLSLILRTQYRFAEANELYKRAVGGFVAVSRPSHPIAITYQNH
jgi:hypothetical protein